MDKAIFGILSILLAFFGYLFYFKSMFSKKTKPHAFSWLIWGILALITFVAQITSGAGPGSWISAFWFITCLIVFLFALKSGEKQIVMIDWLSLFGALISLFFWYLTSSPFLTIILVTLIDCIGFIPTVRKSYTAPYEENATLYSCSAVSYVFSVLAMEQYSIITTLNPTVLIVTNVFFVCLLVWRRKRIE